MRYPESFGEMNIAVTPVTINEILSRDMDISIVIPLFNEEESLPELAAWIPSALFGAMGVTMLRRTRT